MRRKDREMDREFALHILDSCEWAVVSMNAEDGPYCIPLSIVRKENSVYFHCAQEGKKTECLRKDPRVCITAVGNTRRMEHEFTTEFESAIAFGTAKEITDPIEKTEILRLLCERHTPKNMENFDTAIDRSLSRTAIWQITLSEVTGKCKKVRR